MQHCGTPALHALQVMQSALLFLLLFLLHPTTPPRFDVSALTVLQWSHVSPVDSYMKSGGDFFVFYKTGGLKSLVVGKKFNNARNLYDIIEDLFPPECKQKCD